MSESEKSFKINISIEWLKDLVFKLNFQNSSLPELYIDETHDMKSPEAIGPDPARLLLSAVMGCLNASFAFCLKKAHIPLKKMNALGELTLKYNADGFLRISRMDIELIPEIEIKKGIPRMEKCMKIFHNYCTITESVRKGIPVDVKINKDKIKTN